MFQCSEFACSTFPWNRCDPEDSEKRILQYDMPEIMGVWGCATAAHIPSLKMGDDDLDFHT